VIASEGATTAAAGYQHVATTHSKGVAHRTNGVTIIRLIGAAAGKPRETRA